MAFHFLRNHPVYAQINTHNEHVQEAHAQARAWANAQTQHDTSHSVHDESQLPDGDKYMVHP